MAPLILVSNDDSIAASGVHTLIDRLLPYGEVVAVCPDAPRSAQSMALTVNTPLRITPLPDYRGAKMYKVNGTPVDCIKISMHHILDRRPDLVVTGINHGSNSSVNVLYSGTMGAAMEGCAFGIPSVGFSLTDHSPEADFTPCFPAIDTLIPLILEKGLPTDICLNVNVPAIGRTPSELRITVPCRARWDDEYREYISPAGEKEYWIAGELLNLEPDNELTDEWALAHGLTSVSTVGINRGPGVTADPDWLKEAPEIYRKLIAGNM